MRRQTLVLIPCLLAAAAGCRATGFYLDNPRNPIPGVRKFAVAPLEATGTEDPQKLGEILATEMVQFPGVEVIHPGEVAAAARKNGLSTTNDRDLKALARLLKADAVLAAEVRENRPYYPPRVDLAARILFVESGPSSVTPAVDLSRQGSAAPQPSSSRIQGDPLRIERVYDGAQREIRDLAGRYARGHHMTKDAIDGADRVLRLPEFYFRFVSNRLISDIFADWQARQALARETRRI